MNAPEDIESLRAEIKALKTEVNSLKEFVKAMYCMLNEEEEYEAGDFTGGAEMGRFNT